MTLMQYPPAAKVRNEAGISSTVEIAYRAMKRAAPQTGPRFLATSAIACTQWRRMVLERRHLVVA